jgi:hypothetical protein
MNTPIFDPADVALLVAELRCPSWCIANPGHGTTEQEIREAGGIYRHHRGEEILAVERPKFSHHPVTVQVEQYVDLDPADGITVDEPVVCVRGAGGAQPGLTVEEAAAVARAVTAAVTTLGGDV